MPARAPGLHQMALRGTAFRGLAFPGLALPGLALGGLALGGLAPQRPTPRGPGLRRPGLRGPALRGPGPRGTAFRGVWLRVMAARRPTPWWRARPRLACPRMRAPLRASPPQPPLARARGKTPAGLGALPARADGARRTRPAPAAARTLAPRTAPAGHRAARPGHRPPLAHSRAKTRLVLSVLLPPWMPAETAAEPCWLFPSRQTPWEARRRGAFLRYRGAHVKLLFNLNDSLLRSLYVVRFAAVGARAGAVESDVHHWGIRTYTFRENRAGSLWREFGYIPV